MTTPCLRIAQAWYLKLRIILGLNACCAMQVNICWQALVEIPSECESPKDYGIRTCLHK